MCHADPFANSLKSFSEIEYADFWLFSCVPDLHTCCGSLTQCIKPTGLQEQPGYQGGLQYCPRIILIQFLKPVLANPSPTLLQLTPHSFCFLIEKDVHFSALPQSIALLLEQSSAVSWAECEWRRCEQCKKSHFLHRSFHGTKVRSEWWVEGGRVGYGFFFFLTSVL